MLSDMAFEIPNNIPAQMAIVRRAKRGDSEAIGAIEALPEGAWMRQALADPSWPRLRTRVDPVY